MDVIFLLLEPLITGAPVQPGEQHLIFGWQALAPAINVRTDNVMDRLRACRTPEEVFDLVVAAHRETPDAVKTSSR